MVKRNIYDFSLYSSAQVIMILISIVTNSLWARYTTQEQFGSYQLFMSFIVLVGVFNLPGLGMSMQLSSAKEKNGNLDKIIPIKYKYSLLSSAALLGGSIYYYFFKNDTLLATFFLIGTLLYPTYNFNTLWENWLTGIRKINKLSILLITNSLILLISVSFGVMLLNSIVISVLSIFVLSSVLNVVVLKYFTKENDTKEVDDSLIKFGFTFSGSVIIAMITNFDKFIISEFVSLSDVAIYAVAMTFVLQIKIIYISLNKIIAPSILKANSVKQAWDYLKNKLPFLWLFFIILGVIGFFFIDDLIIFIFTQKYAESAIYAQWLWLGAAIIRPIQFVSSILKSQKMIKFSYILESINGFGKVGLFILLIPMYKLWGVVYAVYIVDITALLFTIYYFRKEYKKSLSTISSDIKDK